VIGRSHGELSRYKENVAATNDSALSSNKMRSREMN